jgi:hypothetical protein
MKENQEPEKVRCERLVFKRTSATGAVQSVHFFLDFVQEPMLCLCNQSYQREHMGFGLFHHDY